jgi:UDP-N-acetylmuramate--alanine ligase
MIPPGAHVHISGVGGVGMNAIAQLLAADGCRVTGSDRFLDQGTHLPLFEALEARGVTLVPQDGAVLTADTAALVISTAVEADNPERLRARELGIPERHRAEMLADFAHRGPQIAIAGTSGKTTCTGWLGVVLESGGLNPNVINGGGILNWKTPDTPGNVRLGQPDSPWVVEVDESDKSLLRFHPGIALITSITADHHSLADTIALFRQFALQVKHHLVCGPGVREHLQDLSGLTATLHDTGEPLPSHLPGHHNQLNAAAVARLGELAGLPDAREHLTAFRGVERRLERLTPPGSGPQVYDDYAHNPEKIAAAIRALQKPGRRLTVLWRPHGFAPLRQNFDALADAFANTLRPEDQAWILPVFYAGGQAPKGIEGEDLARAIQKRGANAKALPDYPASLTLTPGQTLLVMGARDPQLPAFAQKVASAHTRG